MRRFINKDVEEYYDQTEVHYRMFWGLNQNMGLHYGVWEKGTKSISESVINTNKLLMKLGEVKSNDIVLDAGCGVGGSSIFLAKKLGCKAIGITLSKKQVKTAKDFALAQNVEALVDFIQMDYTNINFEDKKFDVVWAIESMQTTPKKDLFFKEINRVLKPQGKLLIADCFKSKHYNIDNEKEMQTMLNGWAMSDIITVNEFKNLANTYDLKIINSRNITKQIYPSAKKIYYAGIAGMFGTKIYNLFYNASPFSKIHYKTSLAQYKSLKKKLWEYHLIVCKKD